MSIFDSPKKLKNIKLKQKGPWKDKSQTFEALPEVWGEDPNNDENGKNIKFRLNLLQFFIPILNVLGYILFFGGVIFIVSVFPDKQTHHAHPLIGDSIIASIIIALVLVVIAFLDWGWVHKLEKKRNKTFKQDIVLRRLQTCFDVTEYVYNQADQGAVLLIDFIKSLQVKSGSWNQFSYNDYFRGTYEGSPFILFDCTFENHQQSGRNSVDYLLYKGQIILIELNQKLTDSRHTYRSDMEYIINENGEYIPANKAFELEKCERISTKGLVNLLSGKIELQKQKTADELMNVINNEDLEEFNKDLEASNLRIEEYMKEMEEAIRNKDHKRIEEIKHEMELEKQDADDMVRRLNERLHDVCGEDIMNIVEDDSTSEDNENDEPIDTIQLVKSQSLTFEEVLQAAKCEVGMIFSGNQLVLLLQNKFDPFEFEFTDMFRSYSSVLKRTDHQVSWLWSIFSALKKTGWIGANK